MGCLTANAPFLVTSLLVTIIVVTSKKIGHLLFRDAKFRVEEILFFFAIQSNRVFFPIETSKVKSVGW